MSPNTDQKLLNSLFDHLNYQEALEFREFITPKEDPYPDHIKVPKLEALGQFINELDGEKNTSKIPSARLSKTIINLSGCPTITEFMPSYIAHRKWDAITEKNKRYIPTHIKKCIEIIGDLPVDQILPTHATQIAEVMEDSH